VESGSPASQAGLVPGDLIVALGEIPISGVDDLHRVLTAEQIGMSNTVTILRSGVRQKVSIVPAEARH
jgi:S1-C subfamily serine protease